MQEKLGEVLTVQEKLVSNQRPEQLAVSTDIGGALNKASLSYEFSGLELVHAEQIMVNLIP